MTLNDNERTRILEPFAMACDLAMEPMLLSAANAIDKGQMQIYSQDDIQLEDHIRHLMFDLEAHYTNPNREKVPLTAEEKIFCTMGLEIINKLRREGEDPNGQMPCKMPVRAIATLLLVADDNMHTPMPRHYKACGMAPYSDMAGQIVGKGMVDPDHEEQLAERAIECESAEIETRAMREGRLNAIVLSESRVPPQGESGDWDDVGVDSAGNVST